VTWVPNQVFEKGLLSESFLSRWIFDVELLVRLRQHLEATSPAGAAEQGAVHELPLLSWHDVHGSNMAYSVAGMLLPRSPLLSLGQPRIVVPENFRALPARS